MNLFKTTVTELGLKLAGMQLELDPSVKAGLGDLVDKEVTVGIRPEHLSLSGDGEGGEVTVVEELGSEAFVHVHVEHQGEELALVVREDGSASVGRGDQAQVSVIGPVHVFGPDGERIGD